MPLKMSEKDRTKGSDEDVPYRTFNKGCVLDNVSKMMLLWRHFLLEVP